MSLERDNLTDEIKNLTGKITEITANFQSETDEIALLKEELKKNKADQEQWSQTNSDLEGKLRLESQKTQSLTAKIDESNQVIKHLDAKRIKLLKANGAMHANLQSDYSDIQQFRANFDSYLDTISQSFDDRQKKTAWGLFDTAIFVL